MLEPTYQVAREVASGADTMIAGARDLAPSMAEVMSWLNARIAEIAATDPRPW